MVNVGKYIIHGSYVLYDYHISKKSTYTSKNWQNNIQFEYALKVIPLGNEETYPTKREVRKIIIFKKFQAAKRIC